MSNSNAETATPTELNEVEGARVGWLELFYDLVVVAWLAHTNMLIIGGEEAYADPFEEGGSFVPLVIGAGLVLYVVWMTMTTINNKFPASGLVRRTTMFGQMFFMLVAMLSFDPGGLPTSYGIGSIGIIFLICGIAYADVGIRIPAVRRSMFASAGAAMVAFLICLGGAIVSSLEHPLPALPFAVAGAVILMIPLAAFYRPKAQTAFRIDMHHLDERWGQLTLITLGESFLLFAEELTGVHEIPNLWLFFIVFVTIVAIWRLYFDSAMRRPYKIEPHARHYYVLIVAQFFLIIGLISTIDAMVDAVAGISEDWDLVFALLIVGTIVLMLSLTLLTWARRGRIEGVVVTNLVMVLVLGHWTQLAMNEDAIDIPPQVFVVGVCLFITAYAWCINLLDKHANRLFQSKLPSTSRLHQAAAQSNDATQSQQ
ncbi:MAG: low temperature requirement protein A [Candidatus Nanopelagicales bacterium]